jgi:VanZ family protein
MQNIFHFIKVYIVSLISALIILIITTIAVADLPQLPDLPILGIDKLAHFGVFYLLTTFLIIDIQNDKGFSHRKFFIAAFIISAIYGGMIELIQHFFFVYRTGSIADLIANMAGSLTACFIQHKYNLIKY